jgi:hypothetical protein
LEPETIDLADVVDGLLGIFENRLPSGYLLGRTVLRDAVTRLLGCSLLEAEDIVDTMVARGFLKYEGPVTDDVDDAHCRWVAIRSAP